jgi:DNA topoisomerase-3
MRLFIAENPYLAKTIFEGQGGSSTAKMENGCFTIGDDKIISAFGHMLSLCEPHDYDQKYKVWRLEDLPIKRFDIISQFVSASDEIINSADAEAEEQFLLIDEILTHVGNTKPVTRLLCCNSLFTKLYQNDEPNWDSLPYERQG